MFRSTGVIHYSPKLIGPRVSDKWWMIIDCDPEIGRYLRHLYHLSRYRCETLSRPAWKEHITVIRDEEPLQSLQPLWEAYQGCTIDFLWDLTVHTDGVYYWVPIQCSFALEMREELGLARNPYFPLHLSIAHNKVPNDPPVKKLQVVDVNIGDYLDPPDLEWDKSDDEGAKAVRNFNE